VNKKIEAEVLTKGEIMDLIKLKGEQ
jgi:hypothetical protein